MEEKTMPLSENIERFRQLFHETDRENPRPEDVLALRKALEKMPELINYIGSMARQCQGEMLNSIGITPAARQAFEVGLENLYRDLGGSNGTILENLVIDQILICHIRLYMWEMVYQRAGQDLDPDEIQKWENVVASAQKRYFRAIEKLAQVRRLGVQVQVNIAADGGKQINIGNILTQSDSSKKE
jgi:hypothetical protein